MTMEVIGAGASGPNGRMLGQWRTHNIPEAQTALGKRVLLTYEEQSHFASLPHRPCPSQTCQQVYTWAISCAFMGACLEYKGYVVCNETKGAERCEEARLLR